MKASGVARLPSLVVVACCGAMIGAGCSSSPDETGTTEDTGYPKALTGRAAAKVVALPGAVRSEPPPFREGGVIVEAPITEPTSAEVTFKATTQGVDMILDASGCQAFFTGYAVRIHDASSCEGVRKEGPFWDGERGKLERDLHCQGTGGEGKLYYSRRNSSPKPWSLSGGSDSNLVGHVVVIHDPVSGVPLACGPIVAAPDAPPPPAPETLPSVELQAQIAGYCVIKQIPTTGSGDCPDAANLAECSHGHCGLAECVETCSTYIDCLEGEADPCGSFECAPDSPCIECMSAVFQCGFSMCHHEMSCAPEPTPGGPCTLLHECCDKQGDFADACNAVVTQIEELSGDPSCEGGIHDWDFNTHLQVDCGFDFPQHQ